MKTFEKDQAKSYEEIDEVRAQTQGHNVSDRMTTRICSWAAGKWKTHSRDLEAETQEAWYLLEQACADHDCPQHKIRLNHLRNVLKTWPAKAGLGIDLWVIKLWNLLPDEGLRVLIRIMYLALDGVVPMQMLLVLIGLLPKDSGGERPIALTAMLYRVIMKIVKPECEQWDRDVSGFWDTAIAGSTLCRPSCTSPGIRGWQWPRFG